MRFAINPAQRSFGARRAQTPATEHRDEIDGSTEVLASDLPVPFTAARPLPPNTPIAGSATIEAQIIGERRGLRAGASVIDRARATYTRTEWSGSWDRRAVKGRTARTEI